MKSWKRDIHRIIVLSIDNMGCGIMNEKDRKKFLSGFTNLENYSPRELNKLRDAAVFTVDEEESVIALFFESIFLRIKMVWRKIASKQKK